MDSERKMRVEEKDGEKSAFDRFFTKEYETRLEESMRQNLLNRIEQRLKNETGLEKEAFSRPHLEQLPKILETEKGFSRKVVSLYEKVADSGSEGPVLWDIDEVMGTNKSFGAVEGDLGMGYEFEFRPVLGDLLRFVGREFSGVESGILTARFGINSFFDRDPNFKKIKNFFSDRFVYSAGELLGLTTKNINQEDVLLLESARQELIQCAEESDVTLDLLGIDRNFNLSSVSTEITRSDAIKWLALRDLRKKIPGVQLIEDAGIGSVLEGQNQGIYVGKLKPYKSVCVKNFT